MGEVIDIKKIKIFLKILLIISFCIFPLFFNIMGGIALIYNAHINISGGLIDHADFISYRNMGAMMASSGIMMTFATVFVFRKKNIISVTLELIGLIMCMYVLFRLRNIAAENGLSDSGMTPYKDIYFLRHFPTILHSALLCILAFLQRFWGDCLSENKKNKYKKYTNQKYKCK